MWSPRDGDGSVTSAEFATLVDRVSANSAAGGGGGSVTSNEVSAVSAQAASALSQAMSVLSVRDAALSVRVDSVANAASIISNALLSEISNRQSADNAVSAQAASALSQALSALSVVDAALSVRVDSVANAVSVVSNAVSVVSVALASEVSNRISADNAVSAQAASAISQLQSVLSQRISALSLDALGNVSISSPTSGQVLKYVSASAEWRNLSDNTGAGGGSVTSNEVSAVSAQAASALSQALSVLSVTDAALSVRADSVANAVSVVSVALASEVSNRISADNAVSAQAASALSQLQSVLSQRISALSLDALGNVSISAPTSGQVLKYVSASAEWRNLSDNTGAGGGSVTSNEVSAVSAQAASALSQALSVLSVADAALSARVDSVANAVSVVSNAVSVVSVALASEISNRTSADNAVSAQAASAISQLQSVLSQRISALSVDALKGVSISAATSGQVLKWNSAAGEWQNMADATGGGGASVTSVEYASTQSIASHVASVVSGVSMLSAPSGSAVVGLQSVLNMISNMFSNSFSAGNVVSNLISIKAPWSVAKHAIVSTLQSIQASTVADITSLQLSLEAGSYEIQGGIYYSTSAATAGLRLGVSCPPMKSPTGWMIGHTTSAANQQSSPGIHGQANLPASATTVFLSVTSTAAGAAMPVAFRGMMRVSTAGTMRIKAGGIASVTASPLNIMEGSYVRAFKLE